MALNAHIILFAILLPPAPLPLIPCPLPMENELWNGGEVQMQSSVMEITVGMRTRHLTELLLTWCN